MSEYHCLQISNTTTKTTYKQVKARNTEQLTALQACGQNDFK